MGKATLKSDLFAIISTPLIGCTLLLGETFDVVSLRNPDTGRQVTCIGHVGKGVASQAEIDTMNACSLFYKSKGYQSLDQ